MVPSTGGRRRSAPRPRTARIIRPGGLRERGAAWLAAVGAGAARSARGRARARRSIENDSARAVAGDARTQSARSSSARTRRARRPGPPGRRGHQQGVDAGRGHVAVAGEVGRHDRRAGGHRLEQHDAEGLAAERRRAEHRRAPQAGRPSRLGDASEPLDPRIAGVAWPAASPCRARRSRPTAGRRPGARCRASSSTSRPLRGSWRPQKKIVGPSRLARLAAPVAVDLDAVEQHLVGAAHVALGQRRGVGRHGAAQVEVPGQPAHERAAATGSPRCRRRRGTCRRWAPGARSPRSSSARARSARGGGGRRTPRRAGPGWCAATPPGRARAGRSSRWRRSGGCCRAA